MNKPVCILGHVKEPRLGNLGEVLDEAQIPHTLVNLDKGEALPQPDEIAGVISMGGPMGVGDREKYSFLGREIDFYETLPKTIPALGFCLAAQLMTVAHGGSVRRGEWEVGWKPVLNKGRSEVGAFNQGQDFFQLHHDWISFENGEAQRLMSCTGGNSWQAFRVGEKRIGLQFHPEANEVMIQSVVEEYRGKVDDSMLMGLLDDCESRVEKSRVFLSRLIRFLFLE